MSHDIVGPAPEVAQNKLRAELAARLAAEQAALQPPKIVEVASVDQPKPAVETLKVATPADTDNPALLKYEALPDKDLKQMAINRGLKFSEKNFDRVSLIKQLAGV
jgi:hypothetical protein